MCSAGPWLPGAVPAGKKNLEESLQHSETRCRIVTGKRQVVALQGHLCTREQKKRLWHCGCRPDLPDNGKWCGGEFSGGMCPSRRFLCPKSESCADCSTVSRWWSLRQHGAHQPPVLRQHDWWRIASAHFQHKRRSGASVPCAFCLQCRIARDQSDTISENLSEDQLDWTAKVSSSWWLSHKTIGLPLDFAESKQATRSCLFSSLAYWNDVFWAFFSTLHIRAGMLR